MRSLLCILIVVLAVIACGCTSPAPAQTPSSAPGIEATIAPPVIPDLTGTYAGPMRGYDEGTGFSDYANETMKFVVTDQKDRIFAGRLVFTFNGTQESIGVAGVIAPDGKSFVMAEKDNGYTTGWILPDNGIELTYLHEATPYSAAIDTLKRV